MPADLYIEEIAARAGLEGSRRDYYITRLRERLATLTQRHEQSGRSTAEAEAAATREIGTPREVARSYGSQWSPIWTMLEAAALGALTYMFTFAALARVDAPFPITRQHLVLVAIVSAIIYMIARLRKRVWVDDAAITVYRPFRSAIKIPFAEIHSVEMSGGRLFGEHRVRINFGADNHVVLPSSYRNFRFAISGLNAHVPDTIHEKARKYFSQIQKRSAAMATWKKVGLTLGWLVAAGLVLVKYEWLWHNAGLVFVFVAGLLLAAVTAGCGIYAAQGRVKRLLFAVLTALYILLLQFTVAGIMFDGNQRIPFWLAVTSLPLAIILTWWRTRRRFALFAMGAIWLAAIYAAAYRLPTDINGQAQSLGTAHLIPSHTLFTTPGGADSNPVVFCLGTSSIVTTDTGFRPYKLVIFTKGEPIEKTLPPGEWHLWGSLSTGTLLLSHVAKDTNSTASLTQFYTIDTSGALVPDTPAAGVWDGATNLIHSSTLLSPTRKYITSAARDMSLVVVDRDTQTTTPYPQFSLNHAWKWEDDHTLAFLTRPRLEKGEQFDGEITKWLLNVSTGATTRTRTINIGKAAIIYGAPSQTSALVKTDTGFGIVDLATGTSVSLPAVMEDSPLDWNAELNRATYITAETGSKKLVIAGPKGIVASRQLDPKLDFAWTKLSPDGSQVFLFSRVASKWLFPAGRLEFWDVNQDTLTIVEREPGIYTILKFVVQGGLSPRIDSVQWSPDSNAIAWPAGYFFTETEGPGTEMELISQRKIK